MMTLAAGAMFVLACGYLVLALVRGEFRSTEDPAEPKLDGVREEERAQAPGGAGRGMPGRL